MMSRMAMYVVTTLLMLLLCLSRVEGQPVGNESDRTTQQGSKVRQATLSRLSGTVAGGEDPQAGPWVCKDAQGFVRFLSPPVGGYFQVAGATGHQSPEEVADAFIAQNRSLLARDVNAVDFRRHRVGRNGGRSFIRYRQTYGGLEVHASTVIVQVNQGGGVGALVNDDMTDTRVLDERSLVLTPTLDSETAVRRASAWMTDKYPGLTFEWTSPELVIFSPEVMELTGETKLTWRLEIGDSENTARERILVDAHTGEIAYHCFLICSALDLSVVDQQYTAPGPPDQTRDDDLDDPDDFHSEVNRAWDYCNETYQFYLTQHNRDGWNGQGGETVIEVRYDGWPHWSGSTMYLPIGTITDDTVGHEFTHGVLYSEVGLGGYDQTESGAIMEALCDCWGEWIDQAYDHDDTYDDIDDSTLTYNADDEDSGDLWELFEDDPTISHPYRSMIDPTSVTTAQYDEASGYTRTQPDYYLRTTSPTAGWYSGSAVEYKGHHNCGVGNKLGYLLSVEFGNNNNAAALMYGAIQVLPEACDYYDLYFALSQAAINLDYSWEDRENVKAACEAVGIVPASEQDDWCLEGHWKLDETSGTTASDSAGNNDGAVEGSASWDDDGGLVSGALIFDGTDDRVALSSIDALEGRSASIAAWINPTSLGSYQSVVSQYFYDSGEDEFDGFDLYISEDSEPGVGVDDFVAVSPDAISTNQWCHVVGVFNGLVLRIYVNGVEKDVQDNGGEGLSGTSGTARTAYFGYSLWDTGYYFDGLIDDVRVYNYALSEEEILSLCGYREYPRVWSVRNSSDAVLAWIDAGGNLYLRGDLSTQTAPTASDNDEFRIQDGSSNDVGLIDLSTGDMVIYGTLNEEVSDLSAASHFVVKDDADEILAYIDTSGNLYTKGEAYPNSPDL